MTAGQQKKRLHASSVVSCNLQEHCGTKKKKNVVSPHNLKAHISLMWDENQQKVVAKREQIGLTWRKLGPFVNPLAQCRTALADVISIPQEVFGLENMTRVLSYEVWEALSETEKTFLTQFLPKGADAEQVVQALLTGENLHFGNPFIKWGGALCSGKLHPDAILCQEKKLAVHKKAYDLDLRNHNEYLNDNVAETLQKLKVTWTSREGPEKDIIEKMWREGYADKQGDISTASEKRKAIASSRKEEKQQQLYVRLGDGAKYMSYIKITRKQHQLVKEMKHPDGIKSKCLNYILGDIGSYRVQPYEVYEKGERKKLHERWSQLANRDMPLAFANWTERSLQRQQWRRSLKQEMKANEICDYENEIGNPDSSLQVQNEAVMDTQSCEDEEESIPSHNGHHEVEPMITEVEEESVKPVLSKFVDDTNPIEPLNGHHEMEPMSRDSSEGREEIFVVPKVGEQKAFLHSYSTNSQQIPSLNGHHELDVWAMDLKERNRKPDGGISQFVENQVSFPCATKDPWLEVGYPDSYYPINHGLSLGQPHFIQEGPTQLVDLETDLINREAKESLLQKPIHSFSSSYYSSQDRQQVGLQFLDGTHDKSLESGHHQLGHIQEQQQQQQMRERGYYMYSNNTGRYSSPSQELLSPVNWGVEGSTSTQCFGSGSGSNADGSLYSVLSQFNKPTQSASYNLTETCEQPRNMGNGGDVFPFNYMNGHDQAAAVMKANNNISWMNLQHHDSLGKPFLRSWNL